MLGRYLYVLFPLFLNQINFYFQKADTGTKMIHLGKNTKSKIISKGISAGFSDMTYRGLVDISSKASNSNNYTQCDSLLIQLLLLDSNLFADNNEVVLHLFLKLLPREQYLILSFYF